MLALSSHLVTINSPVKTSSSVRIAWLCESSVILNAASPWSTARNAAATYVAVCRICEACAGRAEELTLIALILSLPEITILQTAENSLIFCVYMWQYWRGCGRVQCESRSKNAKNEEESVDIHLLVPFAHSMVMSDVKELGKVHGVLGFACL